MADADAREHSAARLGHTVFNFGRAIGFSDPFTTTEFPLSEVECPHFARQAN